MNYKKIRFKIKAVPTIMNVKLLTIDRNVKGSFYKINFGDKNVRIANHTMIRINDLAAHIWVGQNRYIRAVRTKSMKKHEDGVLYRAPPMADSIYIELNDVEQWLNKWCHRDANAKSMLAAFDFVGFKNKVVNTYPGYDIARIYIFILFLFLITI